MLWGKRHIAPTEQRTLLKNPTPCLKTPWTWILLKAFGEAKKTLSQFKKDDGPVD